MQDSGRWSRLLRSRARLPPPPGRGRFRRRSRPPAASRCPPRPPSWRDGRGALRVTRAGDGVLPSRVRSPPAFIRHFPDRNGPPHRSCMRTHRRSRPLASRLVAPYVPPTSSAGFTNRLSIHSSWRSRCVGGV